MPPWSAIRGIGGASMRLEREMTLYSLDAQVSAKCIGFVAESDEISACIHARSFPKDQGPKAQRRPHLVKRNKHKWHV